MGEKSQFDIDSVLLEPIDTNGYTSDEYNVDRLTEDGWPRDQARILVIARNSIRDTMAGLSRDIES